MTPEIRGIPCDSKRKELERFIVDSNVVINKRKICERFDEFFTNIGPKLAEKIETGNKKRFDANIKQRVLTTLSFSPVDDKIVIECISSLASKDSAGHGGIFLKLLKFLSPVLTKPLSLVINQS